MRAHLLLEEQVLFPVLRGDSKDGDQALSDLLRDHTQIRELLDRLLAEILASEMRLARATLATYAELLSQHERREEALIFGFVTSGGGP